MEITGKTEVVESTVEILNMITKYWCFKMMIIDFIKHRGIHKFIL